MMSIRSSWRGWESCNRWYRAGLSMIQGTFSVRRMRRGRGHPLGSASEGLCKQANALVRPVAPARDGTGRHEESARLASLSCPGLGWRWVKVGPPLTSRVCTGRDEGVGVDEGYPHTVCWEQCAPPLYRSLSMVLGSRTVQLGNPPTPADPVAAVLCER